VWLQLSVQQARVFSDASDGATPKQRPMASLRRSTAWAAARGGSGAAKKKVAAGSAPSAGGGQGRQQVQGRQQALPSGGEALLNGASLERCTACAAAEIRSRHAQQIASSSAATRSATERTRRSTADPARRSSGGGSSLTHQPQDLPPHVRCASSRISQSTAQASHASKQRGRPPKHAASRQAQAKREQRRARCKRQVCLLGQDRERAGKRDAGRARAPGRPASSSISDQEAAAA